MNTGVERGATLDFLTDMRAALEAGRVELPAFPKVVIEVQEVLKNPNFTAQLLAKPIMAEPTLVARFLNMANSTAFNATGRVIIDVGVALVRLGAQKVYSVVLAHGIQELRKSESLQSIARPLEEMWSDSISVAHFCNAVAKRSSLGMPEAFAAGLLHRVGHMYILVQSMKQASFRGRVLDSALVNEWHPVIAKAVLKNWEISETVCDAVRAQNDLIARTGPPNLTDALIAGIRLAHRMRDSHDSRNFASGGALVRLNLSVEECQEIISEAAEEVRALQRVFRA
jgi:HD-like signal output (HDOD) protein